jgi:hypothetical protein
MQETVIKQVASIDLATMLPDFLLKEEATCSSETSVDFQQTTQYYIPEDFNTLFKLRYENCIAYN